ncbi:tetrahydromethanopterin S-methyltransferase subunit H [Candidatus Bathyarchaeota archaeon]|nr:tetrahydromethanopterin S-methyltransferase subunit H [Candidatus Bathyarchaeota archaeon]
MLRFRTQQKVFEIGEVKVGGQPGENPTVLIGSIFYRGHKIVVDERAGDLRKEDAEKLIMLQEEFSEKTGNPCMLDVVGSTVEAMEKFISFTADVTKAPILIDSPSVEVKIAAVKYVSEVGLEKRAVYNSFTLVSEPREFEAIRNSGVKSAMLLAYKSAIMTSEARVKTIKELLPKVEEAGITKPLLDTYVIDIPSLSMACRAMLDLKRKFGLPCGCGAHNAISTWRGLKKLMGRQAVRPCTVTVNATPAILGADFILYGPIENCKYVFPSTYTINTSYKYLYRMKEQIEL